MNKKNKKILGLQYTTEALTEEIADLEEELRHKNAKLWEVICENDRLTLTYEPYRPPGDEHEGLDFYGLIEENDNLTQKVLDKMEVTNELEEEIRTLQVKNNRLTSELIDVRTAVAEMKVAKEKKDPKAGAVSFDFWPLRDWFRFNGHRFDQGRSFQLNIGPIRIDWFVS